MASAALLTKPLVVGLGAVRQLPTALPCLKSGVFLVAGGLPRTCSLPWQPQHPVVAAPAADRPLCSSAQHHAIGLLLEGRVGGALAPSAGEGPRAAWAPAAEPSPAGEPGPASAARGPVADEPDVSSGSAGAPSERREVCSAPGAAKVEASVHRRMAALRRLTVMSRQTAGGVAPVIPQAAAPPPVASCAAQKKRGQGQRQRLQAHRALAASEATILRIQRRKHGLSAINTALRLQQHSALRAWAEASARAREIAIRQRDVEKAVAQATEALREQYRRYRLSWLLHAAVKLRHFCFRAWAAAAERADLGARAAGMAAGAPAIGPRDSTACDTSDAADGPCACGLVGSRGLAEAWGCTCNRVYAGGLLLAHRRSSAAGSNSTQCANGGPLGLRLESVLGTECLIPSAECRPPQIAPPPGLADSVDGHPPGLGPPGLSSARQRFTKLRGDCATSIASGTLCGATDLAPANFPRRPPGAWAEKTSDRSRRSEPLRR